MNIIKFGRKSGTFPMFSNFYNCNIVYDGLTYSSSEAAWQAQKTLDPEQRKSFTTMSPRDSKRAGRSVQLRPDWEDVKYSLMVDILKVKFQDPYFKDCLVRCTGDAELVENTTGWHDNIWGNCDCPRCIDIPGRNLLGKALMEVRAWFRGEEDTYLNSIPAVGLLHEIIPEQFTVISTDGADQIIYQANGWNVVLRDRSDVYIKKDDCEFLFVDSALGLFKKFLI